MRPLSIRISPVAIRYAVLLCLIPTCLAACLSVVQPTQADLNVLLTAEDLVQFKPEHTINVERVKVQKVEVAGISLLMYEYHPEEGLYISSEASVGPRGSGKEHAERTLRGIMATEWFQGNDLQFEEQPIQTRLGENSRFFLLRSGGKPIGNAYITHDDQHGMSMLFSGVYFSDLDQFANFIQPKLRALTNYSPSPSDS